MPVVALRRDPFLDLATELGPVGLHREAFDVADGHIATDDALPQGVRGGSLRRDGAESGDDDSLGLRHRYSSPEDERYVLSFETAGQRERRADRLLAGRAGDDVDVALRVGVRAAERGRDGPARD